MAGPDDLDPKYLFAIALGKVPLAKATLEHSAGVRCVKATPIVRPTPTARGRALVHLVKLPSTYELPRDCRFAQVREVSQGASPSVITGVIETNCPQGLALWPDDMALVDTEIFPSNEPFNPIIKYGIRVPIPDPEGVGAPIPDPQVGIRVPVIDDIDLFDRTV